MNHKRRRPKNRRAGCLLCKYWKANGNRNSFVHQTWQEKKARLSEKEQLEGEPRIGPGPDSKPVCG